MFKPMAIATAIAVSLCACAGHTWAPGPNQTAADFGSTSGQCKLMAMSGGSGGGFVGASGSPRFVGTFVGASVLAGAIGSAVRQQNIYNACMEANGFVAVDGSPQPQNVGSPQPQIVSYSPGVTCDQCIGSGGTDCHAQCIGR
jgi:hypothetical protein